MSRLSARDRPRASVAGAEAARARLRRGVQRAAARPLHPAGGARDLPRIVRGAARSSALPHSQAEHQRARHPDGGPHAPVSGLRRDDAAHAARARRRVPADGGGADRDQVAPAAAEAAGAAGRGARGSARGARPPPPRIRAHEAGRARHRRASAGGARLRPRARLVRPRRGAAPARRAPRRSQGGVGGAHSARARQSPSPRHARAAVGAQRDEPRAEGARARALHGVHGAVRRRTPTSRISSSPSSRLLELAREAAGVDRADRAVRADPRHAERRARRSRSPPTSA